MILREHYGFLVTIITAVVFSLINEILAIYPYGLPANINVRNNAYKFWMWRNILLSLIHSAISAFGVLLA